MSRRVQRAWTNPASASASGRRPWCTWTAWRAQAPSAASEWSTSSRATESAPPETAIKTVSPPWSIPERRRAVVTSEGWSVTVIAVALQSDPDLTVLEELLLPDGHRRLEGVDGETTGVESLCSMGRGDSDHHARLADLETPDPVHESDTAHSRPALAYRRGDFAHLGCRHGRVRLVLEILHPPPAGLLPHHAREEDEAAGPWVPDDGHETLLRERSIRHVDEVGVRAAADRREETDLVPLVEDVIGLDVVGAEGEQRERAVLPEDREAARHRLPGRLDGAALGKVQLDVVAARRFAIAGEEADPDLHVGPRTGGSGRTHRTTSRWGC